MPCTTGDCGVCWVCRANKESDVQTEEHRNNGPCGEPNCGVCENPMSHPDQSFVAGVQNTKAEQKAKIDTQVMTLLHRVTAITVGLEAEVALMKATAAIGAVWPGQGSKGSPPEEPDYMGMNMRAEGIIKRATSLLWVTSQIEALRNIEYL